MKIPLRTRHATAHLLLLVLLAACAGSLPPLPLQEDLPGGFSESGQDPLPESWWKHFGTPALDSLVEVTLAENHELAGAIAGLRAAEALRRRAGADRLPSVEAGAGAQGTRSPSSAAEGESVSAELGVAWEVDLWGRLASAHAAESFRAQSQAEDLRALRLLLSAETVEAWFTLARALATLDLLEDHLRTGRQQEELLRLRLGTDSRSADLFRQQGELAALRRLQAETRVNAEQWQHRLALLGGQPPTGLAMSTRPPLPALPPLPAAGLPAALVERRPDVRAARLQLLASDRDLAVALRERFPRLTLGLSLEDAAEAPSELFQDWLATLAADLSLPLFAGGRLQAEADRREALRAQHLWTYRQTVLQAFLEVEDALAGERAAREALQHLEEQRQLAGRTFELVDFGYRNGSESFLEVLRARESLQDLDRSLIAARADCLLQRLRLCRALGGGPQAAEEGEHP